MRLWMKELNTRNFKKDKILNDPNLPSFFYFLPSGILLHLPPIVEVEMVFTWENPSKHAGNRLNRPSVSNQVLNGKKSIHFY